MDFFQDLFASLRNFLVHLGRPCFVSAFFESQLIWLFLVRFCFKEP